MSEITIILQQTHPIPIKKISLWFREQHSKLQFSEQDNFFKILFSIFSKKPDKYTNDEWDCLKLIACIFTIASDPPQSALEFQFPTHSKNGYLVSSSFILLLSSPRRPELFDFFHKYFRERINFFFQTKPNNLFYDISSCNYFIFNTQAVSDFISQPFFIEDLNYVFKLILQINSDQFSFGAILFINYIYHFVKTLLMSNCQIKLSNDFIESFLHIIDLSPKAPDIFLVNFFHSWFFIVRQCNSIFKTDHLLERLYQITNLFEYTSTQKYHELHRAFPWYLCFYFYDFIPLHNHDQRLKVLSVICNAIHRIKRMDNFPGILDSVKMFSISIVQQFLDNNPFDLFYIFSNLNSALNSFIFQLNKLHGISKIMPKNDNFTDESSSTLKKREVTFYEQSNWSIDSPSIDHYLISDSYEKKYVNEIECAKDFDRIVQVCENIRHHFHSVVIFQIQICVCLRKLLTTKDIQPANTLNLHSYLMRTFSSLINIMVYSSYKQMEIQSFATHEVLACSPVSAHSMPYVQNPQGMLNFSGIFSKYFDDCILKMPSSFLNALALKVSENLFVFMKKRILTYNFLNNFSMLQKNLLNPNSFINLLLGHMIELASMKINLIISSNIDDVNLIFLWISFIIRLAELPKKVPNRLFGSMLKTYQRLIIVSVFSNLKSICHQSVAIRMIHFYLEAVNFHYEKVDLPNDKQSSNRIRPVLLDDFEEGALLDGIDVIFDICLDEDDFMSENSLIPLLKFAFNCGKKEISEKASKICLKIFTPERSTKNPITAIVEFEEEVFESFTSSISYINYETAKKIMEIIPFYASKFLKAFSSKKVDSLLTIDFVYTDHHLILKTISEYFDNSIEEASHLFALISIYFEIVIQKVTKTNENMRPILTLLIKLLKHCYGFDHLKDQLAHLFSYITRTFGDLFIRGESNLYILCLFEVIGINRSELTSTTMELAVSFFDYCKDRNADEIIVSQTMQSLFHFFPISTKFFSILSGFSIFIRYYPQFINLNYIRSMLIQTSEISPLDKSFSSVLNSFLKKFIEKSDAETLKKFVSMVYEIICPLSISVRYVIEKRLFKLKIPLQINNFDSIDVSSDRIIMFQKLALAFLCGIEGDLIACLDQEWIERTIQFFKPHPSENIHCLQKYVRVLSVCLGILRNPEVFNFYKTSVDFLNYLIRFLFSTLPCHFTPVKKSAKKCFKILTNNYLPDLLSVKMIDDFWRNPKSLFSFWDSQPEKIAFYSKLTKILPIKTPPDIIIEYFIEVENYCKKSDVDKMKLLKNFTIILKQFTIKEYITLEPVKSHILNYSSYLENYIECILSLYQNVNIPFISLIKKPVLKFLILFPEQTVNYLIDSCSSPTLFNYYFLKELIVGDKTNVFFQSFLNSMENKRENFALISPCLASVIEKLSSDERFVNEQRFFLLVHDALSHVIHSCSDQSKSDENAYQILTSLSISFLNMLKYNYEIINIVHISSILRITFFNQSDIYQLFKETVFNSKYPLILINLIRGSFKSFEKLPSNMLRIILPYSIKALNANDNQNPTNLFPFIWSQLLNYLNFDFKKNSAVLKSINYLLDKKLPNREQLLMILKSIPNFLLSSDTQTIIYTLKLCIKLIEKKFLPKEIFESIIQQLFSYSKFFEIPYFSYFLKLIKMKPEFVDDLSPKVIETISFFFHDRFFDVKDVQKTITVLLISTQIYKFLPFSFFYSVFKLLIKKMKLIKEENYNKLIEIRDVIIFLIPLFNQAETNLNEQKMLLKTCFKFMKLILKHFDQSLNVTGNQVVDFNEIFFGFLLKLEKIEFPKKLLNLIQNNCVNSSLKFCLICIAAHFESDFFFNEHSDLILSSLEFIKNENHVSKLLLNSFMKFLFDKKIYLTYSEPILSLLCFLLENLTLVNFEKFFIVSNSFISSHFDSSYSILIDKILAVYFEMDDNSQLSNLLFQMILSLTGSLPFEKQMNYIDIVFTTKKWTLSMKKTFTTVLPSLISCPSLLIKAKKRIISTFSQLVVGSETELLKIIHTLKKFGEENGFSVLGSLILLYIFIANESTPVTSFICFEKIEGLLIKFESFKERFLTLLNVLPLNLWSDEYFIYIVAILTEKNKLWNPIFAFSKRLKKIASNIALTVFSSKLDNEILTNLKIFYDNNLVRDTQLTYTQISRTIELFLLKSSKSFNYYNFMKMSEPFSDKVFLSCSHQYIHYDEAYLSRLLYPDTFNDSIVYQAMPNPTKRQEMAVFLTHLCKYEAAEELYVSEGKAKNSYFNYMRKFNSNFLVKDELDFESIITPLLKIDHHHENIIRHLRKCIDFIQSNEKEKSIECIKLVKEETLNTYRRNYSPSVYQREKFVSFAIIETYIEKLIVEGSIPKFNKENLFQCLNSSFVRMIKNFKRFLLQKGQKKKVNINSTGESPSILISPMVYSRFKEVSGISPYGQFALNATQINNFFKEVSEKILSKNFSISNWISFAPFCFNVFIAQQSSDCFSTAYNAYCQIVTTKDDVTIIQMNEASARIITLIRIAIHLKKFDETILATSFIFKKNFAKVWHVWLQQLVEIANNKWFFDISIELFTEMAYRSTLYASKYASKDIQNALHNAIVNEHSFVQISMMNKIAKILNRINSIHLNEIELQTKIQTFINEALKLSDDEISSFNLIEIRKHRNFITTFEDALSNLTRSEIEKIGDFKNWVNEMRQLSNFERELKIQKFTNSSQNLSQLLNQLYEVIDEFNEQMPFIFPIRGIEYNTEFSIFVIHKKIKVFSPNMTSFCSTTSNYSKQHFLIMTKNPHGFRPSVISVNHLLSVIRTILRSSYSTIVRSITLAENYVFEIGSNTILKRLESEPMSLSMFFERDMMITQEDWIKENVDQNSLKNSEVGKLNQNGIESIKSFPKDSLIHFLKTGASQKLVPMNLHGIALSYESIAMIKYIISAPYPEMNMMIMCARSLESPILLIDFDGAKFIEETSYSNFRLSPSLENVSEIWGDCGMKIAFAATSLALTEYLELIRTHLEIILGDEMILNEPKSPHKFSVDELIRQRTITENRFISLSPPKYISHSEKDSSSGWIERINDLIEKAKNPWIQPSKAIPWY
ncbi:hypothetical protein M9Y10_043449 [Tritrichomonas musculus]|uniref:Non-specific serine/threonine protein kinase n=1 Tax=Tritrichomonas musculus TaxID=1915356 RepID=A0ABR2JZP2_9EUKA